MDSLKYIQIADNPRIREISSTIGDIVRFCNLNTIEDIDYFIYDCMTKGYYIEKYGLLNDELTLPETKYIEGDCTDIEKKFNLLQSKYNELNSTLSEITNKFNVLSEENKILLLENLDLRKVISTKLARYYQSSDLGKKI